MKRALLLNADWAPLHFISDWRAIRLVLKGRAEIISVSDGQSVWEETFNTVSQRIPIPATLRLLERVNKKWKAPRFRKKVLFNRDNWSCQFCGVKLRWDNVTIDHVMPRSRGGQTTWLNCVTACRPCNRRKDDRTPDEANMKLAKQPALPSTLHFWDASKSSVWHPDWNQLLPTA